MASDGDRTAMALEAMMNDLGNDRLEDLAKDNSHAGTRQLRCSMQSMAAQAAQGQNSQGNRVLTNENARGWNVAVESGAFQDGDAREVDGLDTIANGRLHAMNRANQGGGWHTGQRDGNARFGQHSGDPINSSWEEMKTRRNASNMPVSTYDPNCPSRPLSTTPRYQTTVQTPSRAEIRTPRPTPTPPPNNATNGWNAFRAQQTSRPGSSQDTSLHSTVRSTAVNVASGAKAQEATPESNKSTTQVVDHHRSESIGVSMERSAHNSSPAVLPHMRGPPASHQGNSSTKSTATTTVTSLPGRIVSQQVNPLISAQLKSINSTMKRPPQSINGDGKARQVHNTTGRITQGVSISTISQSSVSPKVGSALLPHQRMTSQAANAPKAIVQPQLNILYDKKIKACRAITPGNIETVTGRMYFYQHPRRHLIIWEIKWSDGWVEREDIRCFIDLFRKSPSRMIVRRSGGSQAGIRTTIVTVEEEPPAPLTATVEFEKKMKDLKSNISGSSEPFYPYTFEKHDPIEDDRVDPLTLLPLPTESVNGHTQRTRSPGRESSPQRKVSAVPKAPEARAQHSAPAISKGKAPATSLIGSHTTSSSKPLQTSVPMLDLHFDALHELSQGLGQGLNGKTSQSVQTVRADSEAMTKGSISDREVAKVLQDSGANGSNGVLLQLSEEDDKENIGSINRGPFQETSSETIKIQLETSSEQLEKELAAPTMGATRQCDENLAETQVAHQQPTHGRRTTGTEAMASFDLIDTSPFTVEAQPSSYTMALEEIAKHQDSSRMPETDSFNSGHPRSRIKEESPESPDPAVKAESDTTDDRLQSIESEVSRDVPSSQIPSKNLINATVLANVPLGIGLSKPSLIILSALNRADYEELSKNFDESLYWLQQTGMYSSGSLNEFAAVHETLKHLGRRTQFKMLNNEDRIKVAAVVYYNLKKLKVGGVARYNAKSLTALRRLAHPCPPAITLVNYILVSSPGRRPIRQTGPIPAAPVLRSSSRDRSRSPNSSEAACQSSSKQTSSSTAAQSARSAEPVARTAQVDRPVPAHLRSMGHGPHQSLYH
ncbi:hypothetical protein PFICI_06856 [Pestalotiopsis fici W106-1]|uniref:Uncharacterized protein n=1 Tax=Pestalotiopsis fici (strain W106-1 / CGMCC3.15140) TaxID=1229662 RepID=W3X751_PESFW|nr:uncharacterized protein PFICI_06856 [Pestalotiopsis fici W106-1]ETS81854.1 hypothetical protein PFICI_06856 [Pestalotiopsis fici W106-1]